MDLINLNAYTPAALMAYGCCASVWLGIYLYLLWRVRKYQFSEMPIIPLCGFIAWEVLWGYVFQTNMGGLAIWGLRVFAPLSLYIGWEVYRCGHKQFFTRTVKQQVPLVMGFTLASWMAVLYFLIPALDDGAGITTATLLTMTYSAFAVHLLLKLFEHEGARGLDRLSYGVGWARVAANIAGGTFCLLQLPERRWLLVVCVVTSMLDGAYVFIFQRLRRTVTDLEPGAAGQHGTVVGQVTF
jgi:hypothetical protein